jgi:voltage-gated potassium channel
MMEFPIDTGHGDIVMRHTATFGADLFEADVRSQASTRSSARREEDGAIILQMNKHGAQVLKFGADVDELERERLMALMDVKYMTWRHRWFSILEGRPHDIDESLAMWFNVTSFIVVLVSIAVFIAGTAPEIGGGPNEPVRLNDPLLWIEATCILYFSVEVVLRVTCVPFAILFNALFIIDLVTIGSFFTDFFTTSNVSFLRVLRLLRVFRVMKISRYSSTLQLVFKVFVRSASGLTVLLMPIFLVVITGATALYFVEITEGVWDPRSRRWLSTQGNRPIMFQSIFDGIWFTMTTITTIGYGDFVPQTLGGKMIASALALFGVLTLSFPNLVLGANLESAFSLHQKSAARSYLAKRFRKVHLMIAFVRRSRVLVEIRRIREEQRAVFEAAIAAAAARSANKEKDKDKDKEKDKARRAQEEEQRELASFGFASIPPAQRIFPELDDEPNMQRLGGAGIEPTRVLFSDVRASQCLSIIEGVHEKITDDNVRSWAYKGITVRLFLQCMLEAWSGVASVQEVFAVMPAPTFTVNDVAVVAMFLGGAGYVNVFSLRRSSIHMVLSLTHRAVLELSLHRESGLLECHRAPEYARFIWKQTTGKVAPYHVSMLHRAYPGWVVRCKYATHGALDPSPDFKLHIGVTPAEIAEARRIMLLRTSDLQTVIPDIDRFEEQALERRAAALAERQHEGAGRSDKDKLKDKHSKDNPLAQQQHQNGSGGGGAAAAARHAADTARRQMQFLLEHQRALAARLGVDLEMES